MINLNDIKGKEELVNALIMEDDAADFYLPREKKLLALNFDLEEMKSEFENWLIENSEA